MPRSSRHKSSKHSSRDARDYSDSEKDSGLKEKEKKTKEESSGLNTKESGSCEKRKLESKDTTKDLWSSGNAEYVEEYSSLKRRKDKSYDGASDRWNGGEDDGKGEKKSNASSDSKSKRREEVEGDDARSKIEGKHRESSRKEEREREKKVKEGKGERLIANEEHRNVKQSGEKTELDVPDWLQSPESESQVERRFRKKREGSGDGDGDKLQEENGDALDIQMSLRNDAGKDGRVKYEKHKDERYKDKYREDMDCEDKHRDDKLRDERPARDHANVKSSEKHGKDEKGSMEVRHKKSKVQVSDCECDHDHDRELVRDRERDCDVDLGRDWECERERYRDRDRYRERNRKRVRDHDHDRDYYRDWDREQDHVRGREHEHDRDRGRERDRDKDRGRKRDWDKDRDRERDRDKDRDRERDRDKDRDRESDRDKDRDRESDWDEDTDRDRGGDQDIDHDRDGLHLDERSARYKGSRVRKRSLGDEDGGDDTKSKGSEEHYSDMENKSLMSSRVELDADRGRPKSHQTNFDANVGSSKRRTSPCSSSHGGANEYRYLKQEDSKYRDSMTEQRSKAASSREVTSFSGASESGAKYRSMEKLSRVDEGHSGELPIERTSSSKVSPISMMERSSPSRVEHRCMNRSGVRRSLDIEKTGWRNSASIGGKDRLSRDLPFEKPLLDESSLADSSFYSRAGQSNSSVVLQPPGFRAGIDSHSFMVSLEEDNIHNLTGRCKRSVDMNVGRGQGNAWRGAPNWQSPVLNRFMPFQPRPCHGGFQAVMPQFSSPSMFGVRPSMEINHSRIPYHIPDGERFSNHLRPIGWPNMMDGSGLAHLHSWDGNNVFFRDEMHMFGGPEWKQNRHPVSSQGWDTGTDVWRGQNGDIDLSSTPQKEEHHLQAPLDDVCDGQENQMSQYENSHSDVQVKSLEIGSNEVSPLKRSSRFSPEIPHMAPDFSKMSSDDAGAHCCQVYLSKLDISAELAGSKLYDQCVSLVNLEHSKNLVKDVTMLVNLKNGGRAVQKASIAVRSPSLIPAANASVFQKSMDLYKKLRLQMGAMPNVNGGMLAFISASDQEKGKEQSSDNVVEESKEPALTSDAEMLDSAMPKSNQQKVEAVTTAASQENMEQQDQLVSVQSGELPDHIDTLSPEKSELPNTDFGQRSLEVSKAVLNGNETEEIQSEHMILGYVVGDSFQSLDKASSEAVLLPTDGENSKEINKTEGDNFVYSSKERQTYGDANSGSLLLSDGSSPKVSGALIPGSNEPASVILNRIHHSSENTH